MRLTSINIIMGTLKELRCQKNIDVKCRHALRVNFICFKLDTTFHNTTHQSLSFFPLRFVHSADDSENVGSGDDDSKD